MRKRYVAFAMMLAIAVSVALAQTSQQQPTTKAGNAQQSAGQPAAKSGTHAQQSAGGNTAPVAEMQKLNFMLGNWTTAEKFEPSEFVPKGGAGKGDARIHAGPGGLSLVENYRSRNAVFGPFSGLAVLWWDSKTSVYRSHWCDSMMACENSFGVGKWESDKLVFTSESEYQGKKIAMRSTFSDIKPDSFTWSEEVSTDGGPMKPSMTIQYTLAAKPGSPAKPHPKM